MRLSIIAILLIVFGTSCEKVIDLNLNSTSKKYVIEGNITDAPGTCAVKITQTKDFNENNDFPGVSGAVVTISDNGGTPVTLTESTAGLYQTTTINGTTGHTYTMTVTVNGQTFTASSTMPVFVPFDSIFVENSAFGGNRKVASVVYTDPVGLGNGYHFIEYKNGVQESTVFARDDEFSDGRKVTAELLTFGGSDDDDDKKKINTGDTVRVVMECIDPAMYKYWHSIDAASGDSNSATPANPVTNITGGSLGYFSAHTVSERSIVAQ